MKTLDYFNLKTAVCCIIVACSLQGCNNDKKKINLKSNMRVIDIPKPSTFKLNDSIGIPTLVKALKSADTVLFIEHILGQQLGDLLKEVKPNIVAILKAHGLESFLPQDDYSHQKYVKRKYLLTPKLIDSVAVILTQSSKADFEETTCIFMPHYSFLIVKNGHLSFVDLCFNCELVGCSEDLKYFKGLRRRDWQELRIFFKALKFNGIKVR